MSAASHAPKLKRQAEAVFYSFRFVLFSKTNTLGQPGRDFWMDGRLILSFQDAMQTGGYPQTDDGLSVSIHHSMRRLPKAGLFTIHELTEALGIDER